MQTNPFLSSFLHFFAAAEDQLGRKVNILIFLVIRFVLISAMVVGFSWYVLDVHP